MENQIGGWSDVGEAQVEALRDGRASESGSLRSSEERELAILSVWVSDEKCLVMKNEGVKRVRE